MPKPNNENLWLPDSQFTQEEADATMMAAAEVYAELGIVKSSRAGTNAGKGNIALGLVMQAAGELAVVAVPFEELALDGYEMTDLRQFAATAHPHTAELMTAVIAGLEAAIRRREMVLYG